MNKNILATAVGIISFAFYSNAMSCTVSDVTFEGDDANSCMGPIDGNDNAGNIGYVGFDFLVKDESSPDTYMGIEFSLTGITGGDTSGVLELAWTDVGDPLNLPLTMDLVFVLKASDAFASYLFEGIGLAPAPDNSGSGTWLISFENNGGQIPGMSHGSVYGKVVDTPDTPLSEPLTLGYLGMGLLAGFVARRRREKK